MRYFKVSTILLIFLFYNNYALPEVISIYDQPNEGDIFIGESKEGLLNGLGIFYSVDGLKYFGELLNGEFTGLAKLIDIDKNYTFMGRFYKGKKSGYGVEEANGEKIYARYSNDQLLDSSGHCMRVYDSQNNFDDFCYRNNNWKKLGILNLSDKKKAKQTFDRASDTQNQVNIKTYEVKKIEREYLKKYPHSRADTLTVCQRATTLNGNWESYESKFNEYRYEANKRNLSIDVCNSLTGRISNSKISDIVQNSSASPNQAAILIIFAVLGSIFFAVLYLNRRDTPYTSSANLETNEIASNKLNDNFSIKSKLTASDSTKTREDLSKEWGKATKLKKSSIVKDNKTNTVTTKKSKFDDSDELKAPSIIREKSDQDSRKKQSIKTKQSKIIKIEDISEIKTKVCSYCETENTGDKTNCIICLKPLA